MQRRIGVVSFSSLVLLSLILALPLDAQPLSVLHTFAPGAIQRLGLILTNADGANPAGGLTPSGATLYGAAKGAGTAGSGTLFAIDTNGANFRLLYTFSSNLAGNSDGADPNGGLVLAKGALYGTAFDGGNGGSGVVFSINTNTLAITNLYTFTATDNAGMNSDGANPNAGLILSGSTLFGTASAGGKGGSGTLFSVATNGTTFTVLHNFSAVDSTTGTNTDGANPSARLTRAGSTLFGTTSAGGSSGNGAAFAINTDGTGFTILHNFDTNAAKPTGELVLSGATLYGMASSVVFSLATNGTAFAILHQFSNRVDLASTAIPGLTIVSNTLFGAAASGGANSSGEVFSMDLSGNGFTPQYDFTAESGSFPGTNSDGAFPNGGLVSLNGNLYGTTGQGGTSGNGVVFNLTPSTTVEIIPPLLSAQLSAGNFILGFQTVSGQTYSVQQIADLTTTNWNSFTNFLGDGALAQFTVPISNPNQFFRVLTQ